MKANMENTKKNNEKGVSFDALETIDRHSNSMDKSASLVSKVDMKLDNYKSKIYQGRNRGCRQRQDSYRSRDKSYIVETMVSTTIGEEEITIITIEITGPTIEVEIDQEMAMEIGEMMGKIIEETIIERIVTKGTEIEVQVKIMVDQGQDIGIIHGIAQIQEIDMVMIETKAETKV